MKSFFKTRRKHYPHVDILTQTTYSDALTEYGAYEVFSHSTLVSAVQGTVSHVLEILEDTLNVQQAGCTLVWLILHKV